jgi:hypothetical protein
MAVRFAISEGLLEGRISLGRELCNKFRDLVRVLSDLLPRAHHIYRATVETGFHQALEEAHRTKLMVVFGCSRTHGQTGPQDERQRKPDARPHFLNYQTVRNLADDIAISLLIDAIKNSSKAKRTRQ